MKLRVKLYGTLRLRGEVEGLERDGEVGVELPDNSRVRDLLALLDTTTAGKGVVISEGRILSRDDMLDDDASLSIFQPLAGG